MMLMLAALLLVSASDQIASASDDQITSASDDQIASLSAFYARHDPSKLSKVKGYVEKLDWEKVNAKLFDKYGESADVALTAAFRKKLLSTFYAEHDPSKLVKVDGYVDKLDWQMVNAKLRQKYGVGADRLPPGNACFFECLIKQTSQASNSKTSCASSCTVTASDIKIKNEKEFESLIPHGPLFVKFYAPYCGHCKKMQAD